MRRFYAPPEHFQDDTGPAGPGGDPASGPGSAPGGGGAGGGLRRPGAQRRGPDNRIGPRRGAIAGAPGTGLLGGIAPAPGAGHRPGQGRGPGRGGAPGHRNGGAAAHPLCIGALGAGDPGAGPAAPGALAAPGPGDDQVLPAFGAAGDRGGAGFCRDAWRVRKK